MRRKHKRGEQLQRILFHITNAVITTSNLPALIGIIREQLGSLIDTTNFYIAIYDEASDTFSLPFMADQKDRLTSFPAGKTLSSYVLKSKVALLATRSELDKMEAENLIKTIGGKAKVWLGVPLISSEKAIGIVAVQSYEDQDAYSQHDLEVLMFVSDQIVLAIERKKAEQDLRASLVKAEEGDKLKTSFLANISHEIRTPMHSISSCSELLDEESLSQEERREYINIINESCQELLDVFQKLIDIAKIDAGQFNINRKLFNINDLLADLKKHYETKKLLLGKNAINFQVEIPVPAFEPQIKTDQEKLRQVLKHLLDNAIKFCEEGSVTFGYEVHDDHLLFFVKDTGIGIAPGMQEFVFEKFRQVEENYSRTFSGNGLGLPISKGLVKLLGGTIWLESEEGLGTTFYFTIPRHE
jgi:signal transduction histidine kinase